MAWVERRGTRYRVRFWNDDGKAACDGVFPTRDAAQAHADTLTPPATPHPTAQPPQPAAEPTPAPAPASPVRASLPPLSATAPAALFTAPTAPPAAPPFTPAAHPSDPGPAPATAPPPRHPELPTPAPLMAPPPRGLPARMTSHHPTLPATYTTPAQYPALAPIIDVTPHPAHTPHLTPVPARPTPPAPAPMLVPPAHTLSHPPAREVLLTDWVQRWWLTLDIGPNTASHYRSLLKNHILPRWGAMPMHLIAPSDITLWLKSLNQHYARATTTSIGKLLALVLAGAVIEGHLATNPVHLPRRRGRERDHAAEDQMWATEHEVITLARRITHLAGPTQGLLIITAAYTGMRWGELAALRRTAHNHTAATLTIHRDMGNLLEVDGHHSYGPPKTAASVRTVTLPPFLNTLLQQDQLRHTHDHLFTSPRGNNIRRSTFSRRLWAPATRGTTLPDATTWPPLKPGLTFHNLRHTHKTWLIEDNIPDVAQARRLGHTLKGIDDVYAHVADSVDARLLKGLEARWHRSLTQHALADNTREGNG
ncbi:tyrosine-type recombinase/integrase [Streptomyces sp. NPDC102360]|uniref:tyrosine-type recombinase/integrase n=1 Tax=Streptomyces sp. NPDC102360 TaxID=3366160 RepID=UPI003821B6EB